MHQPTVRIWIGPHSHAVAYPVRGARQLNIVLLVRDNNYLRGPRIQSGGGFGWDEEISRGAGSNVRRIY